MMCNIQLEAKWSQIVIKTSEPSFHSLRHTCTTWLKSAGASNALAQMIVGHDSEVVSSGWRTTRL
jgi:integrase